MTLPSGYRASDPRAECSIDLLGGHSYNGITFSRDQLETLAKVYGYSFTSTNELMVAGAKRSLCRQVQADGMRVMAILGKFLTEGQDPVKLVASLLMEAGCDVPVDPEWVEE